VSSSDGDIDGEFLLPQLANTFPTVQCKSRLNHGSFCFAVFCIVCLFWVVFSFCIVCISDCLLSCIFQREPT